MKPVLTAIVLLAASAPLTAQPILPGVERLRDSAGSSPAERGTVLLGELACTACHAAGGAPAARPAPDLAGIGARATTGWLRRFLLDPQSVKPGTPMPKVLPDAADATRAENVELLVHYLASRGGPIAPATTAAVEGLVDAGRELFHSVGCVACHAPENATDTQVGSVPLGDLARKTTIDALIAFLLDPGTVRPGSRMPNLWLEAPEARAIAMYLLREQIDNPLATEQAPPSRPGLAWAAYEIKTSRLPDFTQLEPFDEGVTDAITIAVAGRDEEFALRFQGELAVPRAGRYTFFTSSDDGSRLLLDGEVVVDNDGEHATRERSGEVDLRPGAHALEVQFFERNGGQNLRVSWAGPEIEKQPIPPGALTTSGGRPMIPIDSVPFVVDDAKVARGRELFTELRCAACHEPANAATLARPVAELDPGSGCLGPAPADGAVAFGLSAVQVSELRAALAERTWTRPADARSSARRALAALNCYACHARDGIGGPEPARERWFETSTTIDLGDEGRLPPTLTGVGDKLRPAVLERLLASREHRIRGRFMATRMPGFDTASAQTIAALLVAADRGRDPAAAPDFTDAAVTVGRQIVGLQGFGCVTCHNVNGNRSPAVAGIDLASASVRLNPDWFCRMLRDPAAFRPGTRMPGFWTQDESPFRDLLGGSSRRQIEAVWSYLSLGDSIQAPIGVLPPAGRPAMELVPVDEPIVHRTFMQDVGPRTIVVGFPENVHVAFDAHAVRLAKVWRGRFFDASGVASGRTDEFLGPLGSDVLDLPAPAFARLSTADAPWPAIAKGDRDVGGTFGGYALDAARRPVFRYRLDDVAIEEQPLPVLQPGGAILRRAFRLSAAQTRNDVRFLAWRGAAIEPAGTDRWRSGDVTIVLRVDPPHAVRVRAAGELRELVVDLALGDGEVRFEEELRW